MAEKQLMTARQVAEELRISVSQVFHLRKRGILPAQESLIGRGKGGTRFFYLRSDVEKLKAQTVFLPEEKHKGKGKR